MPIAAMSATAAAAAIHTDDFRIETCSVGGSTTWTESPLSHRVRSVASASAVEYRSSGFFARHLRQTFSRDLSTPSPALRTLDGGGTGFLEAFRRISMAVSPVNGCWPEIGRAS